MADFIVPIEMQTVNTATIGAGAFTAVGNPLEGSLAFIRITNASNTAVIISYDGATDHEYVEASGGRIETYFQINAIPANYVSKLRKGTVLYVRGTAGIGLVYISGYYNG